MSCDAYTLTNGGWMLIGFVVGYILATFINKEIDKGKEVIE